MIKKLIKISIISMYVVSSSLFGQNQTETLSPIYPEGDFLPFTLEIEEADFALPGGVQAYVNAIRDGKWVIITGRANGMHGFDDVVNNFPPQFQNTEVIVVDPEEKKVWHKSLTDPSSKLTQTQIDDLSVTAAQGFQKGNMLYLVGGYGINTATGEMETKSVLTQINLDRLIEWVIKGKSSVKKAIKQVSDHFLQVTGGFLFQANETEPMLLMLGQNFAGLYRDSSNGDYTRQIRRFCLHEKDGKLSVHFKKTDHPNPDYRRRDLNIVPVLHSDKEGYIAFSGVFTLDSGIWTVPIKIQPDGSSFEHDPEDPHTFKQGMNSYNCPAFGLYSGRHNEMFVVFPGGISFGYFSNGVFQTDPEIPFINQVTTIKIDKHKKYSQYLMNNEYPYIVSTGSNPGNQLLFGAEAMFFPKRNIPLYENGVIKLDDLHEKSQTIGYIVGGIMSTVPNTTSMADSTASPYIFKVILKRKD